jgi:RND superfamily putative drug exporter
VTDPRREMITGPRVSRFRWVVLAGWAAAAVWLGVFVPGLDPAANEPENFLPASSDYVRAVRELAECFPGSSGLSEAVVVFERGGGELTARDLKRVESVAAAIRRPRTPGAGREDLAGVSVRSPADIPLPVNPLKSDDARAALIIVNIPAMFVTVRASRIVDHVRQVVAAADLPEGLAASVTGSSGFGHDYAEAGKRSHERVGYVTIVAVIVILLLVYRAPIAALVPLAGISAAAFVAMRVLGIAQHFGMHVGTGERIFCFVLIYGAGMDYSLLFISRCRELLDAGAAAPEAVAGGLGATFPAILASAGTDAVGLLMLCAAQYAVFRTAGPAMAMALVVALLAAVTLVPAMVALSGRAMFWPGKRMGQIGVRRLWPRVARLVTARPGVALGVTLLLLAVPAARALRLTWVYDALAEVRPGAPDGVGNAAAGIDAAKRHWPAGQIAPVTVLLRSGDPVTPEQ